jgi:hypothetical protein
MARIVLIVGESGSGKSRSIKNLNHEETFILRVIEKDLPFPGASKKYVSYDKETKKGNVITTHNADQIIKAIDIVPTLGYKYMVIDDLQYVMSYEFMERAKEKGYEKFTEIGQNMWKIFRTAQKSKLDTIFFLAHTSEYYSDGVKKIKMKTIGNLLDDKITPEGLFTIVLISKVEVGTDSQREYYFITQSDGTTTVKSPENMFPLKMENDLQQVLNLIIKYNNGD